MIFKLYTTDSERISNKKGSGRKYGYPGKGETIQVLRVGFRQVWQDCEGSGVWEADRDGGKVWG